MEMEQNKKSSLKIGGGRRKKGFGI